jgi:hypothetical protein
MSNILTAWKGMTSINKTILGAIAGISVAYFLGGFEIAVLASLAVIAAYVVSIYYAINKNKD